MQKKRTVSLCHQASKHLGDPKKLNVLQVEGLALYDTLLRLPYHSTTVEAYRSQMHLR